MFFDCPPNKPRISHDGWSTAKDYPLWSVTHNGDFRLFDTLAQACDYIRKGLKP